MHNPIGVGHSGHLAGEIVPAGVQGGRLFALLGPGTRGTLGVAAVGFELFLRNHIQCDSTCSIGRLKSVLGRVG